MKIEATIPVRIESALNLREHWRTRAGRNSSHRSAAWFSLKGAKPKFDPAVLPCTVMLTRIAPRPLDGDNLQGGFKSIRDGIADWLGVDDADPRVTWLYAQERGAPKYYACRVQIRGGAEAQLTQAVAA